MVGLQDRKSCDGDNFVNIADDNIRCDISFSSFLHFLICTSCSTWPLAFSVICVWCELMLLRKSVLLTKYSISNKNNFITLQIHVSKKLHSKYSFAKWILHTLILWWQYIYNVLCSPVVNAGFKTVYTYCKILIHFETLAGHIKCHNGHIWSTDL